MEFNGKGLVMTPNIILQREGSSGPENYYIQAFMTYWIVVSKPKRKWFGQFKITYFTHMHTYMVIRVGTLFWTKNLRTFKDAFPIFQGLHSVQKRASSLCLF